MANDHLEHVREIMKEHYPRFSEGEYQRRYSRVHELVERAGVDALLVYGDSGHCYMNMANIRYLSNYADHMACYIVLPRVGEPTLFMSIPNIQPGAMAMSIIPDVRWAVGTNREMASEVAKRLTEVIPLTARIGIVGPDSGRMPSLPHHHYLTLSEKLPQVEFVNLTAEMEAIRRVQSGEEIAWLEKGAVFTDQAMAALVEAIEPGVREYELYGATHASYLPRGGTLMFSIIGSTPMGEPSMPHPFPWASERPIQKGDVVVTEISASYYGYAGQIIRAVALGKPPSAYQELFQMASQIYRDVSAVLKPGATEEDVLRISRRIPESGFTSLAPVVHGWGLGLGWPYVGIPGSEGWSSIGVRFEENMTVMIEPHVCARDMTRGIQIGNLSRVTLEGAVSYQKFPVEFVTK